MELTFLGTSAGAPTNERNVAAVALRDGGSWDLFDCGEATQHQLMRTSLSLSKLRRIFISHLHGDHCFGLFGLLGSRSMERAATPLTIVGPPGIEHMVNTVLDASSTFLTYEVDYIEIDSSRRVHADEHQTVDAIELTHRVQSFAWLICETDRPGVFDPHAAAELGVGAGPLFGRLKRGQSVTLADGRVVEPDAVVGPPQPGRRIVIAGDNSDPESLLATTGPVDLVVHEATFTEADVARIGDDHGHSTGARVARAAQRHATRHLILTHFSARHASVGEPRTIPALVDEVRRHYDGGLDLANDFDRFGISPDGAIERL
jgi:ribonuclease Z